MEEPMTDDPFFERLREEAPALRYEAEDVTYTRLAARIRGSITAPMTVSHWLARWFGPLTASVAALALTASLGLTWYQQTYEPVSVEQISSIDTAAEGYLFSGE
jgi:hypothetical protein